MSQEIRSKSMPLCYLCGSPGSSLYTKLTDRLFGASGEWGLKKCVNKRCGLMWLDPAPLAEELPKVYDNYYTHVARPVRKVNRIRAFLRQAGEGYLARRYGYRNDRRSRYESFSWLFYLNPIGTANLDFSVFYLPSKPTGRLLEIGFGGAEMLGSMHARGWEVEGIDFDPVSVKNAEAKGLKVYLGSLEEQQLRSEHYDAIVMSHVIEHVLDPLVLLKECHRLLRKGGVLVSITPNSGSLGHRLYRNSWLSLDPPRHIHIFNRPTMCALAARSGFATHSLRTTIRDANSLFAASARIRKGFVSYDNVYAAERGESYRARLMQLVEWVLLKVSRWHGEEMVLIARKAA